MVRLLEKQIGKNTWYIWSDWSSLNLESNSHNTGVLGLETVAVIFFEEKSHCVVICLSCAVLDFTGPSHLFFWLILRFCKLTPFNIRSSILCHPQVRTLIDTKVACFVLLFLIFIKTIRKLRLCYKCSKKTNLNNHIIPFFPGFSALSMM